MKKDFSNAKIPLGGRIGRLAKIILEKTNLPTTEKVMEDFHIFESSKSYPQKAAWIRKMMDRLEETVEHNLCIEIMKSCGSKCCGPTTRKHAQELMNKSATLEELINKLNKTGIGGGRLQLVNNNKITGGYDKCYCGMVKQTKELFPTLTYCQCSVGWYKQLFQSIFKKNIEVELIQSIITGAKTCEFFIYI